MRKPKVELDEHDKRILMQIQENNRLPIEEIGKKVGLSSSAVQRRIKRMQEQDVILSNAAMVSPEKAGYQILSIVEVMIDKDRPLARAIREFRQLMIGSPEVMQCYDVTGEYDFIAIVASRDMADYEETSGRLFMENPNVRRYKSNLVIRRVKYGMKLNLDASG